MPSTDFFELVDRIFHFQLFVIKETPVTLASLVILIAVILLFEILGRILIKKGLVKLLSRTNLDEGLKYAFVRISHYLVLILGAIVALEFVGFDMTGLFVLFGFLSVGIGFGLQNIASNFISGIILLFERPIKVGDRVTVGDVQGDVEEINIRSTTVRSLNNISIIVPNAEFVSTTVVNWSHGDQRIRLDVNVGVSYGSDLDTVLRCLREVALENQEVLREPAPDVLLSEFGESSWNMTLRAWIADPKRNPIVRSDMNCAIVRKFRENGVEIPFPQRDLHVRSPLPVPFVSNSSPSV